jgi:hypothetical protein
VSVLLHLWSLVGIVYRWIQKWRIHKVLSQILERLDRIEARLPAAPVNVLAAGALYNSPTAVTERGSRVFAPWTNPLAVDWVSNVGAASMHGYASTVGTLSEDELRRRRRRSFGHGQRPEGFHATEGATDG